MHFLFFKKKTKTQAELLIRAHFCFVLVCGMDGIDAILRLVAERVPLYKKAGEAKQMKNDHKINKNKKNYI